jgi:cytochrome c-type biogenesis protein CcmH
MTLWIVLSVMIAVAAICVASPFLRRQIRSPDKGDLSIALARNQINAIEAEVSQGLLAPQDAQAARTEIERRIIAATRTPRIAVNDTSNQMRLISVAVIVGWVVVGSSWLYATLGRPDLPAAPHLPLIAERQMAPSNPTATTGAVLARDAGSAGDVEASIISLAARLQDAPDDAGGWQMLGWSYFNTERYAEASSAYARAVTIVDDDPELWSLYGETLVRAANGLVTTAAQAAFEAAVALNPDDARALFFLGMALEQNGDPVAAVDAWIALLSNARADADWSAGVLKRVSELATSNDISIDGRLPIAGQSLPPTSPAPSPSQTDLDNAEQMMPADRQAMIVGMVDQLEARLKERPDDLDGWLRLMQSQVVLGDQQAARSAYANASQQFSRSLMDRARIDALANKLGLPMK